MVMRLGICQTFLKKKKKKKSKPPTSRKTTDPVSDSFQMKIRILEKAVSTPVSLTAS